MIFAFPCVLLGTVTPSLTKFTVDNLDDTGKTVGKLNALNTIGSIIGTFVPDLHHHSRRRHGGPRS